MRHKAQIALNRLYSLRKGTNNDYPFVDKCKENKLDKYTGIAKLIDEDRETIQQSIEQHLTVDEIKTLLHVYKRYCDECNIPFVGDSIVVDKLLKQKKMWEAE